MFNTVNNQQRIQHAHLLIFQSEKVYGHKCPCRLVETSRAAEEVFEWEITRIQF